MAQDFSKGDRVAFSARWLRSVCAFTGELPFARGTVTDVLAFGRGSPPIVEVAWRAS